MTDKFFQGTYRTNTTYPRYSIVVDGNSANKLLYIAVQDVPANTPLTNNAYWIKYDVENGAITPEDVLAMIKEITGDLDDLTTEDKDNLVSAINELDAEHEALSETVSDIDTLIGHEPLTTEATTVTGAVNELVTGVDGLGDRVDALEERPEPVQSDWNETDTTDLAFIKNKPTIPAETPIATTEVAGKVKPDGTTIVVNGSGTITATAPPQEQVDWDEDDPDSVSYIQNKPTIPAPITVDEALSMTSVNPVQNKVISSKLSTVLGVPTDPSDQPINFSFSQPIPFHNPTGKQKLLQCVTYKSNDTANYVEIIVEPDPNYPLEFDYLEFYLGRTSQSFDFINNALCLVVKNNATVSSHFKVTYYKYSQTGTLSGSYSVNLSTLAKSSSVTDFERGNFVQSSSQASTRITNMTKATPINCEFKSGRAYFTTYVSIDVPPVLNYTINGEMPKTPWEQLQDRVTALESVLNGIEQKTLLWTNPSPNESFALQDVDIDLTDYDAIEIEHDYTYAQSIQMHIACNVEKVYKGRRGRIAGLSTSNLESARYEIAFRNLEVSNTGVYFEDAYRSTPTVLFQISNQYVVPLRIWGIKTL